MKTVFLSMILFIAACGAAVMKQHADSGSEGNLPATDLNRVHEGMEAPDFTLESADNERITLSGYRGQKNVVLVFYRGYW